MSFAESRLPDHVDEIQEMFQHTGGWRNFKALLVRLNVESDWHACHQAATEKSPAPMGGGRRLHGGLKPATDQRGLIADGQARFAETRTAPCS